MIEELGPMDDLLWKFLLPAIGSAAGAVLGVVLAFGRFRREKLWEARFKAYSEVLAAVERIGAVGEYERAMRCNEPTRMDNRDYLEGDGAARRDVDRHTKVSTLLFSASFGRRLEEFNLSLYHLDFDWNEALLGESDDEKHYARLRWGAETARLASDALSDLRVYAEADVGGSTLKWSSRIRALLKVAPSR
jgi:hypothetical protein